LNSLLFSSSESLSSHATPAPRNQIDQVRQALAALHLRIPPLIIANAFQGSYFGGGAVWFSLVGGTIPFSRIYVTMFP
jgi:hypothetical protein